MFKQADKQKKDKNNGVRANSNGTVTWKEKTKDNPRQQKFRASLMSTKASLQNGNVYEAVLMPESDPDDLEERHEWLAENAVDFYNEISIVYSVLAANNKEWDHLVSHPETHPNNGYPQNVKYLWKTHSNLPPEEIGVAKYVESVLSWVDRQITDEDIFPTDGEVTFAENFGERYAKKIFKRLFRVFAIIFENPCLNKLDKKEDSNTHQLKTCFKHFMYFAWEWGMINDAETKVINAFVEPIKARYKVDKANYRTAAEEHI